MIYRSLHFFLLTILISGLVLSSCKKDDDDESGKPPANPSVSTPLHIYGDYFYVNWTGVVGANGYVADVATDQNFNNILSGYNNYEVPINGMFIVENVNPSTTYYVRMRAYNANGSSGNSSFKEFKTRSANLLPNMDMEDWITTPNYDTPSPVGVWTSANKTADLNPELYHAVLFKTDDKVSGNFAAKMVTDSLPGLPLVTGSLSTGLFAVNLNNPLESMISGVPYKSRPVRFQGYYKYFPVDGDSCEIRTTLTRWNFTANKRDTVGETVFRTIETIPEYTFFDMEVIYFMSEEPDTIDMVFAASAGGEYFIGGIGSTLFVDDFNLVFSDK
ncbi:MAG TPA: PCMD domain-containing protein [Bacteroidales bacterium]|nr:PCMD domain-containing protein [Bacteroidales bacterium]